MTTDAQGRLLSEDGFYYWDGTAWQLADQSAAAGSQQPQAQTHDAQGRLLSEDGIYFWDGSAWQLVNPSGAAGSQQSSPRARFAEAMTRAGFQIEASAVPDLAQLQPGLDAALQFYWSLDETTRAIVDDYTTEPGRACIGLFQTGIVTGIESLLQAFDQIQGSLGALLWAAEQALRSVQYTN